MIWVEESGCPGGLFQWPHTSHVELKDRLPLVTSAVPKALLDNLPSDAEVKVCEVHFLARRMYGNASMKKSR